MAARLDLDVGTAAVDRTHVNRLLASAEAQPGG
jgi:hypothetical protein